MEGVGRGSIGDTRMGKSARIEGIGKGRGRGRGRERKGCGAIGPERDMRGEESAPEAMRGEKMMTGRAAGSGRAVSLLDHIDGEAMSEIENMIIEDEGLRRIIVWENRSLVIAIEGRGAEEGCY